MNASTARATGLAEAEYNGLDAVQDAVQIGSFRDQKMVVDGPFP
jgi:hypothetical protein